MHSLGSHCVMTFFKFQRELHSKERKVVILLPPQMMSWNIYEIIVLSLEDIVRSTPHVP